VKFALQHAKRQFRDGIKDRRGDRAPSLRGSLTYILLGLFCFSQIGLAQSNANKTVLVLYDGGREFSAIALIDRNIESTLNEALTNRVMIFREYMDLTRISPTNYEQVLRDFYRSKYSSNSLDVIVAVRGRPLDFLLKPGNELFRDAPIVSAAMDLRQINARKLPATVTGKSLQVRYWPTLALTQVLQPETDQVVIVLGASANDRALEALVRDELREHEHELKFTYLTGLPIAELLERVRHLPPRTVILFASLAQDGAGRSFLPNDALALIASAANAPTYINSKTLWIAELLARSHQLRCVGKGHSQARVANSPRREPGRDPIHGIVCARKDAGRAPTQTLGHQLSARSLWQHRSESRSNHMGSVSLADCWWSVFDCPSERFDSNASPSAKTAALGGTESANQRST